MRLLALGEGDLQLRDATIVEVKLKRGERSALALDSARKLLQFSAADQELTRAARFVIELTGRRIFRDGRVDQPEFALFGAGVAFGDVGAPAAQRLHLRAYELNASLQRLLDHVIEARAAIFRDQLTGIVFLFGHGA